VDTWCTSSVRALRASDEGGVYDPCGYTDEGHPEYRSSNLLAKCPRALSTAILVVSAPPVSASSFAELVVALLCEYESVLDTTAALQDVWVFGVVVAFADDVRGTELEFFGERGGTCPLDVVLVVVSAGVLAAHDVDLIVAAARATNAFELSRVLVQVLETLRRAYLRDCANAPV
jgi:type III secretory pathway component EscS